MDRQNRLLSMGRLVSRYGIAGASGIHVTADPNSNSLFIKANAEQYKAVERAIRQMDRVPIQVNIEATIAEVTLDKDLQYGVQFFLQNHHLSLGLPASSTQQRLL